MPDKEPENKPEGEEVSEAKGPYKVIDTAYSLGIIGPGVNKEDPIYAYSDADHFAFDEMCNELNKAYALGQEAGRKEETEITDEARGVYICYPYRAGITFPDGSHHVNADRWGTRKLTAELNEAVAYGKESMKPEMERMRRQIEDLKAAGDKMAEALERIQDRARRIADGKVKTGAIGAADYDLQVTEQALSDWQKVLNNVS